MSFDEDNSKRPTISDGDDQDKPKTFFGLEMSDGLVYTVVIVLTIIFVRQVSVMLEALG